ncbi:hypothetical protein J6Y73_05415 [bacterium]|nr:hypothetical protein [bacterium]
MKDKKIKDYNDKNHTFGRIFLGAAIILIVLVPTIISIVLGVFPDFLVIVASFIPLIIFIIGGFIEVITYAPLLGTTGTYLAFFTGNLVNLKVPCAVNARDMLNVKHGSKEGEIVSTVSVATSTIVTTLVIGIGVILIQPLTPILESENLSPAFLTAFTALFGALAYKYFLKDLKLVPIPFILTIVLQIFTGVGKTVLIPVSAIITILFAYYLFKKEKKNIAKSE